MIQRDFLVIKGPKIAQSRKPQVEIINLKQNKAFRANISLGWSEKIKWKALIWVGPGRHLGICFIIYGVELGILGVNFLSQDYRYSWHNGLSLIYICILSFGCSASQSKLSLG